MIEERGEFVPEQDFPIFSRKILEHRNRLIVWPE